MGASEVINLTYKCAVHIFSDVSSFRGGRLVRNGCMHGILRYSVSHLVQALPTLTPANEANEPSRKALDHGSFRVSVHAIAN